MTTAAQPVSTHFWSSLSPFQKIFLIVFLIASFFSFISPLFFGSHVSDLFTLMSLIGLICAVSGVLTSIYQARGEIIVYAFLLINTITYAWIAWAGNLYGQVFQNIILLLPIQIAGLLAWKKNLAESENNRITIKTFTVAKWIYSLIALAVFWYLYTLFLKFFPTLVHNILGKTIAADPSPILDALTTVLTVMAMFLTARRYIEQWWFWIFCNIGAVLFIENLMHTKVYTASVLVGDLSGLFNWLQYGVGAIYGFYLWKKMHRENNRINS
jgi:nicotinamide mononucleotide transporter PnuC